MRLINGTPFSAAEIKSYRQHIFKNLTHGLKVLLDAMHDMNLKVSPHNMQYLDSIEYVCDIYNDEPFALEFYDPLRSLWSDPNVQMAWVRRSEAALPDK
jgi:guanine nucleotide-binding protein subunit alpha, other